MPLQYTPADIARFRSYVGPGNRWTGQRTAKGYGYLYIRKRKIRAHRMAWELANGVPVPPGMFVCHACDDPPCVDATCLWPGTALDNARDAIAKGRRDTSGEHNASAILTVVQVLEIRAAYAAGGCSYRILAQRYDVAVRTIQRVVKRLRWAKT